MGTHALRRTPRSESIDTAIERYTGSSNINERQRLRQRAIEAGIPLADRLARKYFRSGEPPDDLRQVARMGLIKAVDRFDPARGERFAAYAVPTIHGELKRYFRDICWAIKVPRQVQEARLAVRCAQDDLAQRLRRNPTSREVASEVSLPLHTVRLGGNADELYYLKSLNHALPGADALEPENSLGETDPGIESVDARLTVHRLMASLPDQQRQVMYLRYFCDLGQTQIAARVGISQMHVSRLIRRSLHRLGRDLDR